MSCLLLFMSNLYGLFIKFLLQFNHFITIFVFQVKIWFQNRRMKWRQEQKNKLSVGSEDMSPPREEENFRQLQAHT